jgi:hypothetical protein
VCLSIITLFLSRYSSLLLATSPVHFIYEPLSSYLLGDAYFLSKSGTQSM